MKTVVDLIEERKLIPLIGKVSAGKTKFLNVLLGEEILESKSGICTKFVNIIRYNPNLDEPLFYHLKLKQKSIGEYSFYKDISKKEIKGIDNIKKKNIEINKELSEQKENYEEIFYMTEVKDIPNIKNKECLKKYDLVDIPGLSESKIIENKTKELNQKENDENKKITKENNNPFSIFQNDEENLKEGGKDENKINVVEKENINEKKDYGYLSAIFEIIKNKMEGGVIILSIENYYFPENYEIIQRLYSVIKKPIKHFLIILNKMDLSTDYNNDISKCRSKFFKYFSDLKILNLRNNNFTELSALKMEYELKMKKDFKCLLYYYFINYFIFLRNQNKQENFINYLKELVIKKYKIRKKVINSEIEKFGENELNNFKNITKTFIEEINENNKEDIIQLGIIPDDLINEKNEEEEEFDEEDENEYEEYEWIQQISKVNTIKIIYYFFK